MNTLSDLKKYFDKNKIKVTYFDGWKLKTKKCGNWGMAFGEFRQDGKPKTRKEIDEIINKK